MVQNWVVAFNFRPVDRSQSFLLPPDVRDWLAEDHLAWFVIDVIDNMDLSAFEKRTKLGGVGRAAFDPRVLLAVLVYGYAVGQRSSRQLERLCGQDVAFRVITGNDVPDHTTIARFRAVHEDAMLELFFRVLALCAAAGMADLGIVAIDGTKIAANAALAANADEDRLRRKAAEILDEAAAVDAAEAERFGDARGDELPPKWRDRTGRKERIAAALADLEAAKKARAAAPEPTAGQKAKAAEYEAKCRAAAEPGSEAALPSGHAPPGSDLVVLGRLGVARELQRAQRSRELTLRRRDLVRAGGGKPGGQEPKPAELSGRVRRAQANLAAVIARQAAKAEQDASTGKPGIWRNMTDPDSRIMKTQKGWVQGYNAQLAVTDDQIILAAVLVQDGNDYGQLIPMMDAAKTGAAIVQQHRTVKAGTVFGLGIATIVADAGYLTEDNITAPGPDRLIAIGKQHTVAQAAKDSPAQGPPPPGLGPIETMSHQLRTEHGAAIYARRKVLVEPVNGHIKDRIGLREFARRGLKAANSELQLAAATANLLKLHRHHLA